MSSVFRVVKNSNYTTLSNYHFKDKRLSWKAKGLLSTMLSLPEDWNYTIEGLAKLSDDGIKSTNSGLAELEKCGYLVRKQLRNENGFFGATEYTIYEQPVMERDPNPVEELTEPISDSTSQPICQNGQTEGNTAFLPFVPKRQTDKRISEKGGQLNTNILNTKELNTYYSSSSHSDDVQRAMRATQALNEEEEFRVRKRLDLERIMKICPRELVAAVFQELCYRDLEFIQVMNARAFEQVCLAIMDKQRKEPIRMLPNLINTYLDNIMIGIKAAASNHGGSSMHPRNRQQNPFFGFEQHDYDFDALEKDLLKT